jgi:hypothetical protein
MDTHFFFAQNTSFQVFSNGFPYIFFVQKLFFSSSLQIGTYVFFFQGSMRLQVVDPIHEQIKSIQSSIKSTPSLKLHQEFFSPNKFIAS